MTIEHSLQTAMAERAAAVQEPPDRWGEVELGAARVRRRRRVMLGAVPIAAGVAAGVAAFMVVGGDASTRVVTTPPAARLPAAPPATSVPTVGGPQPTPATTPVTAPRSGAAPRSGPAPTSTTSPTTRTAPAAGSGDFGYQLLWPFRTADEARSWEASYASGGHQPWHLDAAQTALSFTQGYLGYGDINQVVSRTVSGNDAHVGVGYQVSPGRTGTAAVIHLVRLGGGPDAPWEVVGTDDPPSFTLSTPAYGAPAGPSPMTVGGRITGVDESITVRVLQPSSSAPLGQSCCNPAGGNEAPWRVTVSFSPGSDPVLTVVAATGGHVTSVERFAVTGVRSSPG